MWQFIVIIKFEQAYLKKQEVFNALMQFISKSLQGQSDFVNVTICIYSDVNPTHFLTDVTGTLSTLNFNSKYILFLNAYNSNQTSGIESQQMHTTLKNFNVEVSYTHSQTGGGLYRPEELAEILKMVKPENEKDKTLLFILDHGSGFAIFGEPEISPSLLPDIADTGIPLMDTQIKQLKYYDFVENDENIKERLLDSDEIKLRNQFNKSFKSFDNTTDPVIFFEPEVVDPINLTMDELAQGLEIAQFKPDVLVLANCFMLCVDTLYALRNSTKILVASSTALTYEIFEIEGIIKSLPGKDKKEAGLLFINSAQNSEFKWIPNKKNGIEELVRERIALFAFDLEMMNQHSFWETLHGCINLTVELFDKNKDTKLLISDAARLRRLNILINYELPYYFIDLFKFFSRVRLKTKHLLNKENPFVKMDIFMQTFGYNSASQFIGKIAYDSSYSCSGPSIKFPFGKNDFDCRFIRIYYNGARENPNRNSFCRDFNWDYFLYLWYLNIKD